MLQRRDSVPHFAITRTDGSRFEYATIWQRRNLLLVLLSGVDSGTADGYAASLNARMGDLTAHETECVITRDPVPGMASPGVVVADRWGEVHFAGAAGDLPAPDEIVEWLRYTQMQCPECQGEAR